MLGGMLLGTMRSRDIAKARAARVFSFDGSVYVPERAFIIRGWKECKRRGSELERRRNAQSNNNT